MKVSHQPPPWAYAPATDTTELPRVLVGNPPTVELHVLDLAPSVPASLRRGRFTGWLRRFASEMAHEHIPAEWRKSSTVFGGLVAGLLVVAFLASTHQLGAALLALSNGVHR